MKPVKRKRMGGEDWRDVCDWPRQEGMCEERGQEVKTRGYMLVWCVRGQDKITHTIIVCERPRQEGVC